jgi:peptidoglycan hydrolase CwlO-like protein
VHVQAEIEGLKERMDFVEGIVGAKGRRGVVSGHSKELDRHADLLCEINNRTKNIELDITVMKGDIARMDGDIAVMKDDIARMDGDIAVMKDDIAGVKTDVADLRKEMNAGFAAVDVRFAAVDVEIAAVRSDVSDLSAKVSTLDAKVSTLDAKLDRVLDKIGA